ncbi:MAG: alginate lyase family protein [Burkholderiaceae bacterium]|nr:alginate lyase family protein [Burkholderiaceae bacterium]
MIASQWVRVAMSFSIAFAAVPAAAFDCPAAPPAVRDIKAQGYYEDKAGSIVDEQKKRENEEMTRPLNDFLRQVTNMTDSFAAERDEAVARCALDWMAGWAQGGALLGKMVRVNNDQSYYMRKWTHGGLAITYLRLSEHATPEQRAQIEPWLKRVALADLAFFDDPKKSRNNHYYWTGVGVMATAVATGDKGLLRAAADIYQAGVNDIQDDGSLPMEMRRAQKALHYHNFALDPLVIMAEMARVNGMDWYAYQEHRIDRLADRVADGFRDSAWFTQQAGVAQEEKKPGVDSGWVEFYRLRAPHPERFDDVHKAGPFVDSRAGGNMTAMAQQGIVLPR